MPTVDIYDPGTPSWVDLASPDLAASVAFYTSLFGSGRPKTKGADAGHYHMLKMKDLPVAGAGPIMMEGQPPSWTTYVSVNDADETIAKVKKAGGTVFVEPMDVLDVGRMRYSSRSDRCGMRHLATQGAQGVPAWSTNPEALPGTELNTRDTSAAAAFYTDVFGWDPETSQWATWCTPNGSWAGRPSEA